MRLRKFQLSIYVKIIFFYIISIICAMALKGYMSYNVAKKELIKKQDKQATFEIKQLVQVLGPLLWESDDESLLYILDQEMFINNILYIKLKQSTDLIDGYVVFEKIWDRNNNIVFYDSEIHLNYLNTKKMFEYETFVRYNGQKVGELTVMVGTGELDFLLTNVIKISLKESAYITFLLLLLLMFGLKLIILNPLKKLTLAVRDFAQKDFSARSKPLQRRNVI